MLKKFASYFSADLIASLIKSLVVRLGLGLTGLQGFIAGFFIKKIAKEASKDIQEVAAAVVDHKNEKKYNEVIHDPKSADHDKIKSELDILNGN